MILLSAATAVMPMARATSFGAVRISAASFSSKATFRWRAIAGDYRDIWRRRGRRNQMPTNPHAENCHFPVYIRHFGHKPVTPRAFSAEIWHNFAPPSGRQPPRQRPSPPPLADASAPPRETCFQFFQLGILTGSDFGKSLPWYRGPVTGGMVDWRGAPLQVRYHRFVILNSFTLRWPSAQDSSG